MKAESNYKIKYCPYCKTNSEDFLSINNENTSSLYLHDDVSIHYKVKCEVCGATGPLGRTIHEALTLWEYSGNRKAIA